MNFSQKLGLFILIVISTAYVYFSFFSAEGFHLPTRDDTPHDISELTPIDIPDDNIENTKQDIKTVKIYVADSNGKLRSVNRNCNTETEKSCFQYAIKELISAPSNWEKSKGFTSEIPPGTKILSIREGEGSIMIDLSSAFEGGGGTESIYTRVRQVIKTAKANTNLPVYLYIDGHQADVIGGEGIMIKQPLNERSLDE